MRKLLIIIESPSLLPELKSDYDITWCHCAQEASCLLHQHFDGMILDLFLPGTDGLTLLKNLQDVLPPVVLVLTHFLSPYISQAVESLGVGYVLRFPFTGKELHDRLEDMFQKFETPLPDVSLSSARYHLHRLGMSASKKGYRYLIHILPKYDPEADPSLFCDFYPALAEKNSVTTAAIDNAIHREIHRAYDLRNEEIWLEYFSDTGKCPANKDFLAAVAEKIRAKNSFL